MRVNSLGHQLAISLGHQLAIIPRFGDDSLPLRLIIPNLKSKYASRHARTTLSQRFGVDCHHILLGISVGYGSEWGTDGTSTFVGRTGGGLRPPRTPPIASAFGDTDGEIFGRKIFRPKKISAEKFFGRIFFRPKKFSIDHFSVEKLFGRNVFGRKIFGRKIFG